jgi:serine/threonine-protein kinase RsbW
MVIALAKNCLPYTYYYKMIAQQTKLRFQSHPNNVERVESFVEKVVEAYSIDPNKHGDILVSLTEAVTNAIRHGNCCDESKLVEVKLRKESNRLAFWISDEGRGFDYRSLPDPTAPDNLCKVGGRGVFLMQQLSDGIRFHDNGRTVELHFKI